MQSLKRAELDFIAERLEKVCSQAEVERQSVVAEVATTGDARTSSLAEEAQGDFYIDLTEIYDRTLF